MEEKSKKEKETKRDGQKATRKDSKESSKESLRENSKDSLKETSKKETKKVKESNQKEKVKGEKVKTFLIFFICIDEILFFFCRMVKLIVHLLSSRISLIH